MNLNDYGKKLIELMEFHDCSIRELSEKIEVPKSTIYALVSGTNKAIRSKPNKVMIDIWYSRMEREKKYGPWEEN
jgi:predicted DNA-binding protein YlxM (UPF0122 family)